jgi:hypothetical protein
MQIQIQMHTVMNLSCKQISHATFAEEQTYPFLLARR